MNIADTINVAVVTLLRPLVRILLRNGVAYGHFAELAKKTYAEVAFEHFQEPGRKQTVSRVSALTGLTRKETKRLLELPTLYDAELDLRYNRAVRVLSGWLNDPEFQNGDHPAVSLPIDGERGSFASLVRKYSGDVPTQAMFAVLARADCVSREDDRVRLLRQAYVPAGDPIEKVHILGTDTGELITTIDHNLTSPDHDLYFQRKVSNTRVNPEAVPVFRKLSAERAQALLESLDAWLSEHELNDGDEAEGRYVSLGIYYYESSTPTEK